LNFESGRLTCFFDKNPWIVAVPKKQKYFSGSYWKFADTARKPAQSRLCGWLLCQRHRQLVEFKRLQTLRRAFGAFGFASSFATPSCCTSKKQRTGNCGGNENALFKDKNPQTKYEKCNFHELCLT
jgi:hypothetical protein